MNTFVPEHNPPISTSIALLIVFLPLSVYIPSSSSDHSPSLSTAPAPDRPAVAVRRPREVSQSCFHQAFAVLAGAYLGTDVMPYCGGSRSARTAPSGAILLSLVATCFFATAYPQLANRSVGDRCVAPDGRHGVCKIINSCPGLIVLLQGGLTQSESITLNRARCGFQGNVPIVCCADEPTQAPPYPTPPITPSHPRPETPPVTPPSRPVPETDGWDDGETPKDVTNHPNLRLLPEIFCSPGGVDRVVGGEEADLYSYPWMARLGYRARRRPNHPPSYRCGGSLINERYVLTAAHCVLVKDFRLTTVQLGEHTEGVPIDCKVNSSACLPPPINRDVEQAIPHPLYDSNKMHHDVALLRLSRPVDFRNEDFVRPVCLPVGRENQNLALHKLNRPMVVAGWGTTETGQGSKVLLDVLLPVVPLAKCKEEYRKLNVKVTLISKQMCAGGIQGKDSCTGDSGGPLMYDSDVGSETKTMQFGIVSFGPRNCGTAGIPGVYTRVGHYMQWILDTMQP